MKMKTKTILLQVQAVGFCLFSANLWAHSLNLTAQYDGQEISGKSYYSDETPAAEIYVGVYQLGRNGSETTPIASGKTDATGYFRLHVVGNGPFKVVSEAQEGHRAEYIADNVAQKNIAHAEFEMLREEIQLLKNHLNLRDIISGIGYILGLFGLAALLKCKKGTT